jgi:hypothetical protein
MLPTRALMLHDITYVLSQMNQMREMGVDAKKIDELTMRSQAMSLASKGASGTSLFLSLSLFAFLPPFYFVISFIFS